MRHSIALCQGLSEKPHKTTAIFRTHDCHGATDPSSHCYYSPRRRDADFTGDLTALRFGW